MPKSMIGQVITDVRDKTIKVIVEKRLSHKKYGKVVKKTTTYHVHDQDNLAKVGDIVKFTYCRPLSKTKFTVLTDDCITQLKTKKNDIS